MKTFEKTDQFPKVVLFTGAPGTGKTTLARIFANMVGASPINIIEKNFADSNGIDTIRKISEECRYLPTGGKAIVYILDEFHAATASAFQAMLKLLEDVPKHVHFVCCTSRPEKISDAIASRLAVYRVVPPTTDEIASRLIDIALAENNSVTMDEAKAIAKSCNGCVRAAIVRLGQYLATGKTKADLVLVTQSLDADESSNSYQLVYAMIAGRKPRWQEIVDLVDGLTETEFESFRWLVLTATTRALKNESTAPQGYAAAVMFSKPFFDTKKAGILAACWKVWSSK